jgi:hypothetical protein
LKIFGKNNLYKHSPVVLASMFFVTVAIEESAGTETAVAMHMSEASRLITIRLPISKEKLRDRFDISGSLSVESQLNRLSGFFILPCCFKPFIR